MPTNQEENEFEIEEIRTKNTSFSVNQLGHQCGSLQYIRELTQNSIEAILEGPGEGEIFWTWDRKELEESSIHKLCIIDNGPSMTGEQIRELMNHMYSSGKSQELDGNYGIGAKVSGLNRSPEGMIYQCYRDGKGYQGELLRRPTDGAYGLRQYNQTDGSLNPYLEIPYYSKPDQIKDSGTVVTLLGKTADEDTFTSPPEGEYGNAWLSRYLNTRYFTIPNGIDLRISYRNNPLEDTAEANYKRRKILGIKHYLDMYKQASGTLEVSGADIHWWVLKENFKSQNFFTGIAHTGSLFQNEIYDLEVGNKTSRSRLNRCGIIHLINRVVIYVKPITEGVTSDPSRTSLLIGQGRKLPWLDWADEFCDNMPPELRDLEDEASERATDFDVSEEAMKILQNWLKNFDIPKFATEDSGVELISPPTDIGGVPESGDEGEEEKPKLGASSSKSGGRGNRYSDFLQDDGQKGRKTSPTEIIPKVEWVSPEDHPHLEDRAAQYIRTQNTLLINEEFRGFKQLVNEVLTEKGRGKPGARSIVEYHTKVRYHVNLCETVLRVQMLKSGGKTWKQNAVDSALSEEALTASVMGSYFLVKAVSTSVGHAIGRAVRAGGENLFVP